MPRNERQQTMSINSTVILLALLVWLSRLAPFIFPEARLWGVNHLLFLPIWFSFGYVLLGLAAAALFIPSVQRQAERALAAVAKATLSSPRYQIWGAIALAAGVIFWLLRMPTHFLGDGYEVVQNVGQPTMAVYKWTERGAIALVGLVARLLPFEGEQLGEYAYAIVSDLSGVITVFLFFGIAYELSRDAGARLFALGLLMASGWMLLFFGYAENYPVLWPFAAGYIYFSLRYLDGRSPLVWPTLFLAAAITLHLLAAVFLLSYPILLISQGFGARVYRRYKAACLTMAALTAVAVVAAFAYNCHQAIEFRLRFLPLLTGWPKNPTYAVLTGAHLGDIINFFSLVVPLWPVLVVMAWRGRDRSGGDPISRFLGLFSLGGMMFLLTIDPKLGMPRDWDLFALAGIGPMLFLTYRAVGDIRLYKPLLPGLLACTFLAVIPFWAANINEFSSLEYAASVLRLDPPVAKSGMVQLSAFYHDHGMFVRADSLRTAIHRQFPEIDLIQKANDLIADGRLDESRRVIDALARIDPYSGELFHLRGILALSRDDYSAAVIAFEQLRRLAPYDYAVYINLGGAYLALGQDGPAFMNFRKAYMLNPTSPDVLEELAMAFCRREVYDSALLYGRKALEADGRSLNGYLAVGLASSHRGDKVQAIRCLTHYVEMAPPGKWHEKAEEALTQLRQ